MNSYIVYEDSAGKLGAIPVPDGNDFKIDFWAEGKTVIGCPAARNESDAIDYVAYILARGRINSKKR